MANRLNFQRHRIITMVITARTVATVGAKLRGNLRQLSIFHGMANNVLGLDLQSQLGGAAQLVARFAKNRMGVRWVRPARTANVSLVGHAARPYMPSYVTGDFFTMRSTCLECGVRSPLRQAAAVLSLTLNNLAAFASPMLAIKSFRFMRRVIHGMCVKRKGVFTHKVECFPGRA